MTEPRRTPNPATTTRPERSSQRVAHKKPLAWLPWVALLALLALAALIWYLISEANESSTPKAVAVAAAPSPSPTLETSPTPDATTAPAFALPAGAFPGALVGGSGQAPVAIGSAGTSGGATAGQIAPGTAGTVLFAEASATPDAQGQAVITAAATALKSAGATTVQVAGYTDVIAGSPVNVPLSQQRAVNVAKALQTLLPGVTVTPAGKGEGGAAATNATAAGRQQNRRATIVAVS